MFESRYRDKKYLSQYSLSVELFEEFSLKVTDVIPVRNVYILCTDKGNKILKKIDYSINDLEYINSAIKFIKDKFNRVFDFVETKDNKIYTIFNGDVYCVMNLIDGRECDFYNAVDVSIAAKGLGELHSAAEGFKYNINNKVVCGKTIDKFNRKLEEIVFFMSLANLHENKNEFVKVFLDNVNYYSDFIKKSIEILNASSYYKLCSEEDKVVLCHHDLAYHNILIYNDEAYFIDFDYAIIDLKVHDLCNFIIKAIKECAFDIEKADLIIKDYCRSNILDKREFEVLYGLMTFPEDFYSITRDYYTRRKEWEEEAFVERLNKRVLNKEDKEEFLEEFKKKFCID